jgi:hypothetical protein
MTLHYHIGIVYHCQTMLHRQVGACPLSEITTGHLNIPYNVCLQARGSLLSKEEKQGHWTPWSSPDGLCFHLAVGVYIFRSFHRDIVCKQIIASWPSLCRLLRLTLPLNWMFGCRQALHRRRKRAAPSTAVLHERFRYLLTSARLHCPLDIGKDVTWHWRSIFAPPP